MKKYDVPIYFTAAFIILISLNFLLSSRAERENLEVYSVFKKACNENSIYLVNQERGAIELAPVIKAMEKEEKKKDSLSLEIGQCSYLEEPIYPIYVESLSFSASFKWGLFSRTYLLTCSLKGNG